MIKAVFFIAVGVVATVAFYEPETAEDIIKDSYATSKVIVSESSELINRIKDGGRLDN